jgi:hypothetical protein
MGEENEERAALPGENPAEMVTRYESFSPSRMCAASPRVIRFSGNGIRRVRVGEVFRAVG